MPVCANCGSWQPDEAALCDECGHPLRGQVPTSAPGPAAEQGRTVVATPPPAPLCPVCGATTVAGDPFCTNCGAALTARPGDAAALPAAQTGYGATVVAMGGGRARPNSVEVPQAPTLDHRGVPVPPAPETRAAAQGPPHCASCGAELPPEGRFCEMCGAPVVRTPSPEAWDNVPPRANAAHWPPTDAPVSQEPTAAPPAQPPGWGAVDAAGSTVAASLPSPFDEVVQDAEPARTRYASPTYEPVVSAAPTPVLIRGKFVVSATNASLPFPPGRDEIIVGRQDPVNGIFPEIDLTDHGGDEGGVSRRHARITQQGSRFAIEDLNSTNHTFVNRSRLALGERRVLYEGDEVAFGRVKMIFQVI